MPPPVLTKAVEVGTVWQNAPDGLERLPKPPKAGHGEPNLNGKRNGRTIFPSGKAEIGIPVDKL